MYHILVFTSYKIFYFINPSYNTHFWCNFHVPRYMNNGKDIFTRDPIMGMPVYFAKPRMSATRRFFDDEEIRKRCLEAVKREGPEIFFKQKNWRKYLYKIISNYKKTLTVNYRHRYESPEERNNIIFEELLMSRRIIEEKLPGKKVIHLCYPWYEASAFAVQASKKAGFKVNYFGQIRDKPTNRPGDDPFRVVRVEDIFLQRLPGKGRKKITDIFKKLIELRELPRLLGIAKKRK